MKGVKNLKGEKSFFIYYLNFHMEIKKCVYNIKYGLKIYKIKNLKMEKKRRFELFICLFCNIKLKKDIIWV